MTGPLGEEQAVECPMVNARLDHRKGFNDVGFDRADLRLLN